MERKYQFEEESHYYIDVLTRDIGQVQEDGSYLLVSEESENSEEDQGAGNRAAPEDLNVQAELRTPSKQSQSNQQMQGQQQDTLEEGKEVDSDTNTEIDRDNDQQPSANDPHSPTQVKGGEDAGDQVVIAKQFQVTKVSRTTFD